MPRQRQALYFGGNREHRSNRTFSNRKLHFFEKLYYFVSQLSTIKYLENEQPIKL
jgi:hypothetical protein